MNQSFIHFFISQLPVPEKAITLSVYSAEVVLVVALADLPGLEEAVKFGAEHVLGSGESLSVLFVPDQGQAQSSDSTAPSSDQRRIEIAVQGVLERAGKPDVPVSVDILSPGQPGQPLGGSNL